MSAARGDDSAEADLPPGAEVRVHVHPPEGVDPGGEHGYAGRVSAMVDVDGAVQVDLEPVGRFTLKLPPGCPLPLELGDRVAVRSSIEIAGIHVVREGLLVDTSGAVLVASSDRGDISDVHGWTLDVGPFTGEAGRPGPIAASRSSWVVLGHAGRRAWLADRRWRRLDADDGSWLVCAESRSFEPGLPLPPDAWSGERYSIVRLRAAPDTDELAPLP